MRGAFCRHARRAAEWNHGAFASLWRRAGSVEQSQGRAVVAASRVASTSPPRQLETAPWSPRALDRTCSSGSSSTFSLLQVRALSGRAASTSDPQPALSLRSAALDSATLSRLPSSPPPQRRRAKLVREAEASEVEACAASLASRFGGSTRLWQSRLRALASGADAEAEELAAEARRRPGQISDVEARPRSLPAAVEDMLAFLSEIPGVEAAAMFGSCPGLAASFERRAWTARVTFLERELGLQGPALGRVLHRNAHLLRNDPAKTAQPVLEYLTELGFSREGRRRMVLRFPRMLQYRAERLRQAVEELEAYGFEREEVRSMLLRFPNMVSRSSGMLLGLEDWVRAELRGRGEKRKEGKEGEEASAASSAPPDAWPRELVRAMVSRFPNIVSCSVPANLAPTLALLRSLGFSSEQLRHVLRRCPNVLSHNRATLQRRVEALLDLGMPRESLPGLLTRQPSLLQLNLSTDAGRSKVRFLTHRLGIDLVAAVDSFPSVLGYSLYRVESRGSFLLEAKRDEQARRPHLWLAKTEEAWLTDQHVSEVEWRLWLARWEEERASPEALSAKAKAGAWSRISALARGFVEPQSDGEAQAEA